MNSGDVDEIAGDGSTSADLDAGSRLERFAADARDVFDAHVLARGSAVPVSPPRTLQPLFCRSRRGYPARRGRVVLEGIHNLDRRRGRTAAARQRRSRSGAAAGAAAAAEPRRRSREPPRRSRRSARAARAARARACRNFDSLGTRASGAPGSGGEIARDESRARCASSSRPASP